MIEDDPELIARLFPEGYRARPEAAILFTVEAWDTNCPQHIPQMLFAEDVAAAIEALNERIAALEAENATTAERSGLNRTRFRVHSCPELAAYLCISIKSGVVPVDDPPAPVP